MPDPVFYTFLETVVGSFVDISQHVLSVSIDRGRAAGIGQLVAGRATLIVNNDQRYFTPENPNGPYYDHLRPNRRVIVQTESSATNSPILNKRVFHGYVDAWRIDPLLERRVAVLDATDNTKELLRRRIDTAILQDTRADSLFAVIFSHAGVTDAASVDTLADVIPFAWFPDQEAFTAARALVETGAYLMYAKHDNKSFVVRNRIYNINSVAPVGSYVNDFFGLDYERSDDKIINHAQVGGETRRIRQRVVATPDFFWGPNPQLVVIGRLRTTIAMNSGAVSGGEIEDIPIGRTTEVSIAYADPDTNEAAPCASVQLYPDLLEGITGSVRVFSKATTPANITDQCSIVLVDRRDSGTIQIFNAGPIPGQLERAEILGRPMERRPIIAQTVEVSSSQTEFGKRSASFSSPFIGLETYALGYAQYLTFRHHDLRPEVRMTLKNTWPDQLTLELLDVIHVVESESAVGSRWQVFGIQHEINVSRGLEHRTTYTLDRWAPAGWFVLDVDRLDTGRLGF